MVGIILVSLPFSEEASVRDVLVDKLRFQSRTIEDFEGLGNVCPGVAAVRDEVITHDAEREHFVITGVKHVSSLRALQARRLFVTIAVETPLTRRVQLANCEIEKFAALSDLQSYGCSECRRDWEGGGSAPAISASGVSAKHSGSEKEIQLDAAALGSVGGEHSKSAKVPDDVLDCSTAISTQEPAIIRTDRHGTTQCLGASASGCFRAYSAIPGSGLAYLVRMSDFTFYTSADVAPNNSSCAQLCQLFSRVSRMIRPSFDDVFVHMAFEIATRSNCLRRAVGAVLVNADRQVISTGYNGTPTKTVDCLAGGCARCRDPTTRRGKNLHECFCVHAESNALQQAGVTRSRNGTLYVTSFPCLTCVKLVIQARVNRVVYADPYVNDGSGLELIKQTSIEVEKFKQVVRRRNALSTRQPPAEWCTT